MLISWKQSLNSGGQQFHQYQQNEKSPLILTHWTQNKERHGNSCLVLGQAQTMAGLIC